MIKPKRIKRNDLQPYYRFSVPNAATLLGATFVCTMTNASGTVVINRSAAGCVIIDAAACVAEYRWQAGQTAVEGTYSIEFEFTPQSGGKFTVPNGQNPALVIIAADLDET